VLFGSRLRVSYRTPLTGCMRDNGTGGASGLARWADRIGIPVRSLEVPVSEASEALPQPAGNCVLTMGNGPWSPAGDALDPVSWRNAHDWLARGNALIIVTTAPQDLPKTLRQDLVPANIVETTTEPGPSFSEPTVDSRPETTAVPVTVGGDLAVETKGPRWSVPKAEGAAPDPKAPAPSAPGKDPARWLMAADGRGGVLYRIPVGRGAVYVLLDEFAWTNAGLDHGDNARVLAGILHREEVRGGVLAFDEYRHGHGRTESFLAYVLNLPGSSALMAMAAIWGLLCYYGGNVRLRPVEPYVERERRTAQEYIDAVAQLYERARAAPLVVGAVARRLRQVARSSAERQPAVETSLQRAEHYAQGEDRPASPTAAIRIVNELVQLRKRIYGTRTVS
jgi:hypothetical protein